MKQHLKRYLRSKIPLMFEVSLALVVLALVKLGSLPGAVVITVGAAFVSFIGIKR